MFSLIAFYLKRAFIKKNINIVRVTFNHSKGTIEERIKGYKDIIVWEVYICRVNSIFFNMIVVA